MPEPRIQVDGDNNRTAGRDYHEYKGPDPCPCCEQRYLTPGRAFCRHCEAQFEQDRIQQELIEKQHQKRASISRVARILAGFMILGLLVNWFGPDPLRKVGLVLTAVSAFAIMLISKLFT
ncbi:hypothetical protein ACQ86O_17880 [Serratia sp. L9]|uniref:hypothetical protein n=1 Tax=Serratia sp. L9 TaxID=3423946 RepID=UPI003D67274F